MKHPKSETYPGYVSYDLEMYFSREPSGPVKCLLCAGNLSKSVAEPSRAMRKEIASPDFHLRHGTTGTWVFTCNACHWWCIREGYEFVTGDWVYKYGHD